MPKPGFWQTSRHEVVQCYNVMACTAHDCSHGGLCLNVGSYKRSAAEPSYMHSDCALGYEGPLCAACCDGYVQVAGFKCQNCDHVTAVHHASFWLCSALGIALLYYFGCCQTLVEQWQRRVLQQFRCPECMGSAVAAFGRFYHSTPLPNLLLRLGLTGRGHVSATTKKTKKLVDLGIKSVRIFIGAPPFLSQMRMCAYASLLLQASAKSLLAR